MLKSSNTHPWNPSWNCVWLQHLSIDISFSSAISSLQQKLVITGLYLHKTFQLQRDCSSCKEFKHKIGIENAAWKKSATRKNQKDLQQNFAVVELARKQEEEEEEENKETKEEEEEYCYLPPSQVHTPPRCIPQEPSRHWFSEAAPLSAIKIS